MMVTIGKMISRIYEHEWIDLDALYEACNIYYDLSYGEKSHSCSRR